NISYKTLFILNLLATVAVMMKVKEKNYFIVNPNIPKTDPNSKIVDRSFFSGWAGVTQYFIESEIEQE
ncbi:MAG: hypothetical protein K8H86_11495, partial [Ignavibacteriaceae bacterium]|nr:hypothetical protein [Ignavibacteriaceae bacterium]